MAKNRDNSKGFTLVETAIVLVIGGLILTMLFNSVNVYMKNTKLSTTRARLATIDNQIQVYLEDKGFLPCPASLVTAVDALPSVTPRYGVTTDCSISAVSGTFPPGNTSPVRIGMVPTRSLNLPDEFGYDAWGSRILYAVTKNLARDTTNYTRDGGLIRVLDSNDNSAIDPAGEAHYVIVSHGIDRVGAYTANGSNVAPCNTPPTNALDRENCDIDDTFRSTVLSSDSTTGSSFYDDLITMRSVSNFSRTFPPEAAILFRLSTCPEGWSSSNVPSGPPSGFIYCRKN